MRFVATLSTLLVLSRSNAGQHLCPGVCKILEATFRCSDTATNRGLDHIPQCVASYPNLRSLIFDHNRLEALSVWSPEAQPHLEVLSVSFNRISVVHDNVFVNAPHLEILNLSHNSLPSVPSGAFKASGGLSRLHTLDLSFNAITNLDASTFEGLPVLKMLVLDSNHIERVDAGAFASLWKLEELSLKSTGFQPTAFYGALDAVSRYRLQKVYLGGNNFACNCDWVKLAAMLNKYKVVVPDMDQAPHCSADDVHCGVLFHGVLEDLKIASERYMMAQVMHDNTHHHVMALSWLVAINVLFIVAVFVGQCMCGQHLCCQEGNVSASPHVSELLCCCRGCNRSADERSCGYDDCWYGCERCSDITWIDGTDAAGLVDLAPWGPPWDKQKLFSASRKGLDAAVTQHAATTANQDGGRMVELADGSRPRPCPECQDTAKGMNILFNESLNLEYINKGVL